MVTFLRSAFVVWALLFPLFPNHGTTLAAVQQPSDGAGQVELRPGVVIDLERGLAYVTNPKAGIDAVRLTRGDLAWHTDQAARPLAATADVLVAQVEVARPTNELVLRTLDARTGRTRRAVTHALPQGTRALVRSSAENTFNVQALSTGAEATLAWQFEERPLQGVRPGALDIDRPPEDIAIQAQAARAPLPNATREGALRVNLATGQVVDAPPSGAMFAPRQLDVPAAARVGAVTGEQFLSADGRHVLSSESIADDTVWEKYQWTIFERSTGRRLGSVRDYRSHAPFMVSGSTIVYETGPTERRTEKGLLTQPLSIRAVELTKGAQLWVREIRDLEYRGPFPP